MMIFLSPRFDTVVDRNLIVALLLITSHVIRAMLARDEIAGIDAAQFSPGMGISMCVAAHRE
jgi:hypothetical protein